MPKIGTIVASLSYDSTGERLRVYESLYGGPNPLTLDILILYKNKTVYTRNVLKGTCVKTPTPTPFPTLQVPANATYINSIYMGPERMYMDTWGLAVKEPQPFYLSMSYSPECWPLSQTSVGAGNMFDQISYYNMTLGIKDQSVWNIPQGCEESEVATISKIVTSIF